MGGFFKLAMAIILEITAIAIYHEEIPVSAQFIGFALVLAGYVAHKED